MQSGMIFSLQPFSLQDGPGIRTTVFFKGCNLRCWWCHNPESWSMDPQLLFYASRCIGCGACVAACPKAAQGRIARASAACTGCGACAKTCFADALQVCGERISQQALLDRLLADESIYAASGGGVTFSGGEPLLQADFLLPVLRALNEAGVSCALESALYVPWETIAAVLPWVALLFCDLKCADPARHKSATGADNALILANLRRLSQASASFRVRTPVIPGFNDDVESLDAIAAFLLSLPHPPAWELLPFHGLCVGKYEALGKPFPGAALKSPSEAAMQAFAARYAAQGLRVSARG